jgi:predicted nucleic acid-binding protein
MIVDTRFVLDRIDGLEPAEAKETELRLQNIPLTLPAMTILELWIGVGAATSSTAERQEVRGVIESYPQADMTPSIARRAGRLLGEQMADAGDGEDPGIGKGDAAIAATAIEYDVPVLAADGHFGSLPGVEVETYR